MEPTVNSSVAASGRTPSTAINPPHRRPSTAPPINNSTTAPPPLPPPLPPLNRTPPSRAAHSVDRNEPISGVINNGVQARKEGTARKEKRGRTTDLTSEEIFIMLREVLAADAHVASHGEKLESLDEVADALNSNRDSTSSIDGKSVRDRYEHMQKPSNKRDKADAMMSGVDGEVCETDGLLSQMREAREEQATQRNERQNQVRDRKQKKLEAGARLQEMASTSGSVVISDDEDVDDGVRNDKKDLLKGKERRGINHGERFEGEMERFGALSKESENGQRVLEEERPSFEKRRFEVEKKRRDEELNERRREREEDRKERGEERESCERLELEKFTMMMDVIKEQRK